MITVQYDNIFRQKIGFRHGLTERGFKKELKKNQKLVDHVFKNSSQYGYAFLKLVDDKKLMTSIKAFARSQKGKWSDIIVLGIGGSALGLSAIYEAVGGVKGVPHLHVIDNIDPDLVESILSKVQLKKTMVVVISKSGSTVEPMSLFAFFRQAYQKLKVKNWQKHFVFVTDPKSSVLRSIGVKEGIQLFPVPEKVGGRFSVLSAVGLLPAALVGINIQKLTEGARQMKLQLKKQSGESNMALQLAISQFWLDRKKMKNITVMMPYANRLFRFGDWYRQLLAESIGKTLRAGPTPVNALGTTDQHSQLQLYSEGPNNKFFIFFRVMSFKKRGAIGRNFDDPLSFLNGKSLATVIDAAYRGTSAALARAQRPNITLEVEKINEENLGKLFMLFEFQMALLGLLYKVNAFDQPGVEESKRLTKEILISG